MILNHKLYTLARMHQVVGGPPFKITAGDIITRIGSWERPASPESFAQMPHTPFVDEMVERILRLATDAAGDRFGAAVVLSYTDASLVEHVVRLQVALVDRDGDELSRWDCEVTGVMLAEGLPMRITRLRAVDVATPGAERTSAARGHLGSGGTFVVSQHFDAAAFDPDKIAAAFERLRGHRTGSVAVDEVRAYTSPEQAEAKAVRADARRVGVVEVVRDAVAKVAGVADASDAVTVAWGRKRVDGEPRLCVAVKADVATRMDDLLRAAEDHAGGFPVRMRVTLRRSTPRADVAVLRLSDDRNAADCVLTSDEWSAQVRSRLADRERARGVAAQTEVDADVDNFADAPASR